MSKVSTISLSVSVIGDGLTGATYTPPQSPIANPNAPQGVPSIEVLTSGLNTIAVPPNTRYAMLVPDNTSTNVKKFKSISGDTGVSFESQVQMFTVTGLATIYIDAAAGETISIAWC